MTATKPGELRVWFIQDPPGIAWRTPVANLGEANLVLDALDRIGTHHSQAGVLRYEPDDTGRYRWFDVDQHELDEVAAALAA
ncbi:hypothetical protein [Nocardia brasiliensis]|uniref:hypothetical protein n=1 Tax=Nocardia brasiliensis TaxID=37326 RepID=UPI00245523C0|nr:hypothetical protein [Nocardia brasiliensis]